MIQGYPGLDAVNSSGQVVVHAKRTPDGYLGGPAMGALTGTVSERQVTLATGQEASALFEGENGPVATLGPCPPYSAILVTPPDESHSVRIPSDYSRCYLEIHPVVPGVTGGAIDYRSPF
jgi:hypothetical protein